MEAWAKSMPQVQFLCVCVESEQVAIAFHRMFRFEHAINGYIPSRGYMPVGYGQLGCSGFIVSDKDGCFVCRKTIAYLDYDQQAFRFVEKMLDDLVPPMIEAPSSVDMGRAQASGVGGRNQNGTEIKKDLKKKVKPPASVSVHSMDDEHIECTHAFNNVIEDPKAGNFELLYEVLKSHFEHEEDLMMKYSESKDNGSFSAFHSHKTDHDRMLKIAEAEMQRVNGDNCLGK